MAQSIHDFTVKDLAGREVDLSSYKGKVLMVVNTASECGFTPQLKDLEKLYENYKDKGFEILAFPSNDFGGQEPLEGDQIEKFCEINYGVKFKIFEKTKVKGSNKSPLFKYLTSKKENGKVNANVRWNFYKYIVDKNGQVIYYFSSLTKPSSGRVTKKIEQLLAA